MKSMFHAGFLISSPHFSSNPCANLLHTCVHCFARKLDGCTPFLAKMRISKSVEQLETLRFGNKKKHPKGCSANQ